MVAQARIDGDCAYLWTLPMFHCNGWCFTWAVTAVGARHVPLRRVDPKEIWQAIRENGITNLSAVPTVLGDLSSGPWADEGPAPLRLRVSTGGAPPAPALLERLAALNMDVTHLYGLTETYGPAAVSEWSSAWDALSTEEQARRKARQGIPNVIGRPIRVVNDHGDVPWDAQTPGEILFRGPNVMMGYYRDPEATDRANADGWFRSGDIGVLHPDGYLEIRDRAKDVIVSGGENIASIEIEQALVAHPSVHEAAVVAAPDPRWGEVPVAFVVLVPGAEVDPHALIDHVRSRIASYKAPKRVVSVVELPRTATGKVQKYALRAPLWEDHDRRVN
jgi:fatty-acyl-CoA synthase